MFAENRNDILAFKETMTGFFQTTKYEWQIVIADSGPYSLQNMKNMQHHGLVPVIRARKNLKTHPIRQLKKDFYFNTDFIREEWSDELFLNVYSFRPMIEQGNSYNTTYYNASQMNTRGMDAAIKFHSFIYILELLKALTSYKLGHPDLVMKPIAFESSRYFNFRLMLPILARDSGFIFFNSKEDLNRLIKNRYRI